MAEGCQYNRPFVQHIAVSHMEQEGQHSTAQSSPTWYKGNSAQHSTAQDGTAGHGIAQHSTAQHSTAQHSTAQHSTAQHLMWIALAHLQHQICFIVCQECNIGHVQLACAYPFLQFVICANDYMRVCVSSQTPAAAACCHSCLLTMQAEVTTVATT